MCFTVDVYVPARDYLAEAKRETKRLKKLKSVSRAYRKSKVRGLKEAAASVERQRKADAKHRAEMAMLQAQANTPRGNPYAAYHQPDYYRRNPMDWFFGS